MGGAAPSPRVFLAFDPPQLLAPALLAQGLARAALALPEALAPGTEGGGLVADLAEHVTRKFELGESCPDGVALQVLGFTLPQWQPLSALRDGDVLTVRRIHPGKPLLLPPRASAEAGQAPRIEWPASAKSGGHDGEWGRGSSREWSPRYALGVRRQQQRAGFARKAGASRRASGLEQALRRGMAAGRVAPKALGGARMPVWKSARLAAKQQRHAGRNGAEPNGTLRAAQKRGATDAGDEGEESSSNTESDSEASRGTVGDGTSEGGSSSSPGAGEKQSEEVQSSTADSEDGEDSDEDSSDSAHSKEPTTVSGPPSREPFNAALPGAVRTSPAEPDVSAVLPTLENKGPSRSTRRKRAKRQREAAERKAERERVYLELMRQPTNGAQLSSEAPGTTEAAARTMAGSAERGLAETGDGHMHFPLSDNDLDMEQHRERGGPQMVLLSGPSVRSKRHGQQWGQQGGRDRPGNQAWVPGHHHDAGDRPPTSAPNAAAVLNFQDYPPLEGLPRVGDAVAYKVIALSPVTWSPEPSDFRHGRVHAVDAASQQVTLLPLPPAPSAGPARDQGENEDGAGDEWQLLPPYEPDGSLTIHRAELLDFRLISRAPEQQGSSPVGSPDQGPAGNGPLLSAEPHGQGPSEAAAVEARAGPGPEDEHQGLAHDLATQIGTDPKVAQDASDLGIAPQLKSASSPLTTRILEGPKPGATNGKQGEQPQAEAAEGETPNVHFATPITGASDPAAPALRSAAPAPLPVGSAPLPLAPAVLPAAPGWLPPAWQQWAQLSQALHQKRAALRGAAPSAGADEALGMGHSATLPGHTTAQGAEDNGQRPAQTSPATSPAQTMASREEPDRQPAEQSADLRRGSFDEVGGLGSGDGDREHADGEASKEEPGEALQQRLTRTTSADGAAGGGGEGGEPQSEGLKSEPRPLHPGKEASGGRAAQKQRFRGRKSNGLGSVLAMLRSNGAAP